MGKESCEALRSAPRPARNTGDKGGGASVHQPAVAPCVACWEPGPGSPPPPAPLPGVLEAAPPGRERACWGCEGRCHLPWGYVAAKAAVRSPEVTNCPLRGDRETEAAAPLLPPLSPVLAGAALSRRGPGRAAPAGRLRRLEVPARSPG